MDALKLPGAFSEMSVISVTRALWKHKLLVVLTWVLVGGGTVLLVHNWPPIYKSEAVILVDSQKIPERFVSSTVNVDLQDRVASLSKQILSAARLQKIIDTFNLYQDQRKEMGPEELIVRMRKDTAITLERGWTGNRPGAFRISFEGPNPAVAADVANQLANLFVEENLRARETHAEGTTEFLDSQLTEARKRLEETETRVSQYKTQHNGELPQQEGSLMGTLNRLQVKLQGNQDALNRIQQQKLMLENSLTVAEASEATLARAAEQGVPLAEVETKLPRETVAQPRPLRKSEQLQLDLELLRARYSDEHPEVKRLAAEIPRLRRVEELEAATWSRLAAEVQKPSPQTPAAPIRKDQPRAAPEVLQALTRERARMADLRSQLALADRDAEQRTSEQPGILREIASLEARVQKLPIREQEMADMTRDYEISKGNYRSLLDKKFDAEMATDMERRQKAERFTLLDSARVPVRPFKPNRPMLDAIGLVGGLLLAVAVALGREMKKNQLLGEWEIPSDVLILGRIPLIPVTAGAASDSPENGRRLRKWRLALVSSALLGLLIAAGIYVARSKF